MRKGTTWAKLSNRGRSAQRSRYDFLSNLFFRYYENSVFSLHFDMLGLIYKRSEVS